MGAGATSIHEFKFMVSLAIEAWYKDKQILRVYSADDFYSSSFLKKEERDGISLESF